MDGCSKKSYHERMLKMKKEILENAGSNDTNGSNDGSNDTNGRNDGSNDGSNDGGTIGIKSNNDVYFYGIGLSILYIGKCYNIKNDLCSRTAHSYV